MGDDKVKYSGLWSDSIERFDQNNTIESNASSTVTVQPSSVEVPQKNVIRYDDTVQYIAIDIKQIQKIKQLCKDGIEQKTSSNHDVFLGISTLFGGATISAYIAGVILQPDWKSVLLYVISPAIAVGTFIAYLFTRKYESESKIELAKHIIEYLPEIGEKENEY